MTIYHFVLCSPVTSCLSKPLHCLPFNSPRLSFATLLTVLFLFLFAPSEVGGFATAGSGSHVEYNILVSRDLAFDILDQRNDDNGRILCMDLRIRGTVYTLCSLYAPTQDKSSEQLETLANVEQLLGELSAVNTIVGGDFNCFLDPGLDRNVPGPAPPHTGTYRDQIFSFMESWSLCDIWRLRNPNKCGYTFRHGNYASRLDLILILNHLSELVKSSSSKMLVHSDHAIVSLVINLTKVQKGPGLWKFDPTLLEPEHFVLKMIDFLSGWIPPPELGSPDVIWEWLKYEVFNTLISENGTDVTDSGDILRIGQEFYEKLYASQEDSLDPIEEIDVALSALSVPTLSDELKVSMDAPFSEEELKSALLHLNKNKSPGSDGLPPEFYTHFWPFISQYVCASLDFSIGEGHMSSSQRRSIITLIPKKDVNRRYIANWRPITLLNTDYKIFSKALALRLQRVMGLLINHNQTGFMPGRIIGDSVRVIEDSLEAIDGEGGGEGLVVAFPRPLTPFAGV